MQSLDHAHIGNCWWRLEHLYRIQTKTPGKKKLLKFNAIQCDLRDALQKWKALLILKARQEGVSTFCLLYHLDRTLFTQNYTAVVLAHRRDSLKKLFRIIKIAYETCPECITLSD